MPSCDRAARAGGRGRSGGAGGGRGPAVAGRCSGGSGGSAPAAAGVCPPRCRGSLPGRAEPVPAAARAAPGAGAALRGRRGRGGQSENSVEVLSLRRPRWETIALGLAAARRWVRGALGAWARKGRIPHPAAWQPSALNCGPEERGRDPAIAAVACWTVIFLQDTCLVLGFAFYNQLTRCA